MGKAAAVLLHEVGKNGTKLSEYASGARFNGKKILPKILPRILTNSQLEKEGDMYQLLIASITWNFLEWILTVFGEDFREKFFFFRIGPQKTGSFD